MALHTGPVFVSNLPAAAKGSGYLGKRLLLVGTGGVKRTPVLGAIRELGLAQVFCLMDSPNWAASLVDGWLVADPVQVTEATLAHVEATHAMQPFDAVFTYDDYSVVLAATIARRLRLAGIEPSAAAATKDKLLFRQKCAAADLHAPAFALLRDGDDAKAVIAEARLHFPLVMKPRYGGGSVYVHRADTPGELERHVAAYRHAVAGDAVASCWADTSLVIEEYIDGPEVDVDLLLQHGQCRYAAVTDNLPPPSGHFVEVGGRLPSMLPAVTQEALIDHALGVLAALGVDDCCVHFEARLSQRGPVAIEANLRVGGAEVYALHRVTHEVDLVEEAVRIALRLPVTDYRARGPRRHAVSHDFHGARSGLFRAAEVPDDLAHRPGMAELVSFRSEGERIRVPPEGYDYLGWLVASGNTAADAFAAAATLQQEVRFTVEQTT